MNNKSLEPQTCPKCFYVASSSEDKIITTGECPACGINVAKYLKIINGEKLDDQEVTFNYTSSSNETGYVVAGFGRHIAGALSSFIVAACLTSILSIIANIYISIRFPADSINSLNSLQVSMDMNSVANSWHNFVNISAPLFIWLFIPILYGRTWGMSLTGLLLARDDSKPVSTQTWVLRQLGYAIIICSFGVLLIVPMIRKVRR